MAASRFVEVTDKEISEIETQKTCVKILKHSSRRIFPDNHRA